MDINKLPNSSKINFVKTQKKDLEILLGIFNYYIKYTFSTLYVNEFTIEQLSKMLLFEHPKSASFTIFFDNVIVGFALLLQKPGAYAITGELSVYLEKKYIGSGIGTIALKHLEKNAGNAGFHSLTATISNENANSIKHLERNNYKKCGHIKEIGKKFDRYFDIVMVQKML